MSSYRVNKKKSSQQLAEDKNASQLTGIDPEIDEEDEPLLDP